MFPTVRSPIFGGMLKNHGSDVVKDSTSLEVLVSDLWFQRMNDTLRRRSSELILLGSLFSQNLNSSSPLYDYL